MVQVFEAGLVTVEDPVRHGKAFALAADGSLQKQLTGWHRRGRLRRVRTDLRGLLAMINQAGPGQHLVCGVPPGLAIDAEACLAAADLAQPGDLTRTEADLPFPAGPGLMVIDNDLHGDVDLLQEQLHDACPSLAEVRTLATSSSSANIWSTDGTELRGATGLHQFVPVADARDIPRALQVLNDRLWLAGHGAIRASDAGLPLLRSPVDLQMHVSVQPVFLHAHCGPGLEQRKGFWWAPSAEAEVALLDTRTALPDLTDDERARLQVLQRQTIEDAGPALADARAAYTERRQAELVARGVAEPDAQAQINAALEDGDLYGDWPIELASGETVTVADILADPARFHGRPCRDPIEPEYGSRSVAKVYSRQPKPVIRTHAHGGREFFLHAMTQTGIERLTAGLISKAQRGADSLSTTPSMAADSRAATGTAEPGARRLRPVASNFSSLAPARWVLQDFIAAGEVVTFAGQPGVGKSTVFAGLALLVAGFGPELGSDLGNDRPRQVAVVSENPAQYMRIIHALCVGHGLNPDAVAQVVHLYATARMRLTEIDREISAIIEERRSVEPPLLILDTASASFELESENDNALVGAALAKLRPLAEASGAAIWIVAHAAKALSREDSDITPRGASAWVGDVHGTGSVFRERDRPDTVFLRSLKNRWERGYDEIAVATRVTVHEVVDDRGLIQQLRIRTGVPRRADANQQQRHEQRRAAEQSVQTMRARHWMLETLQAHPDAPTSQAWLEDAAKNAHDMPRSAVRSALESLQRDGRICLQPIHPRPKNGARERFVLTAQTPRTALAA